MLELKQVWVLVLDLELVKAKKTLEGLVVEVDEMAMELELVEGVETGTELHLETTFSGRMYSREEES